VKGIFINERGQRFVNEDCYHGRCHSTSCDSLVATASGCSSTRRATRRPTSNSSLVSRSARLRKRGRSGARVAAAAGIADQHGGAVQPLRTPGEDPLFHKAREWLQPLEKPPFVALDCRVDHCFYSSFTLGGLDTLPTARC